MTKSALDKIARHLGSATMLPLDASHEKRYAAARRDYFELRDIARSALGDSERADRASREMIETLRLCEGNISSLAAAHPAIYGEWLAVVRAAIAKAEAS